MREALLFQVEGDPFALLLDAVQEVLQAAWPLPLPRAPFGCLGLLDVRGEVLPLMDMGALLGLRRPLPPGEALQRRMVHSHVLLVRLEQQLLGLWVDRVLEVGHELAPEPDAADPDPGDAFAVPGKLAHFVTGMAEAAGTRALLLDAALLLGPGRRRLLLRTLPPAQASGRPL